MLCSDPSLLDVLTDGLISVDEAQRRVEVGDREVELTPTESRLLAALMRNRNQVVTLDELLETVWGNAAADPKQVRLYVSDLRRKLREAGGSTRSRPCAASATASGLQVLSQNRRSELEQTAISPLWG